MKKILLITTGIVLLLLIAAVCIPFLFKDKIFNLVKESANKEINAVVNFNNDLSISIFSHFPNLTITVNDISVAGINEFEGDTLIAMKSFSATLDIMSVIKGDKIKVKGIEVLTPRINAIILTNGKANWDITKVDSTAPKTSNEDTASTKFNIALKQLVVTDASIIYNDKQGNIYAHLTGFNHTLKGDFSESLFELITENTCKEMLVSYGGITYLNKVNMSMNATIDADMNNMKFTFKENKCTLNNLAFGFTGWFAMPGDDMKMDIKYEANKAEFKDFLSLIPTIYAKDFSTLQSSGKLAFNGMVNGTYNDKQMPAFSFNLLVENGMFKYPALPAPVSDVAVNLQVTNPDGNLNNTKVNLTKLHFAIEGDAFDAKLIATNVMKDPTIDAVFKGLINLDNITKIVPMEEGTKVSGKIAIDLTAKGKVSTVENKQYEDFDAQGSMEMTNINYSGKELKQNFQLNEALITFSPKLVSLKSFNAKIGSTDIQMNGDLSNFFAYAFSKGTIKGNLNITSNYIDANQFLSNDTTAKKSTAPDTTAMNAPEIPGNIDFNLNCNIGKLLYSNLEITNFKGGLQIANQKLTFNKMGLNTLGSSMTMDGYYETTNPKKPSMSMIFGINNLDIQKAFVTFNTVKKIAPIAEKTTGTFSTHLSLQTILDQHLNPIYDGLYSEGNLDIPHATIKDVAMFNKAAEVLKYDKLRNPALNNVHIKFKVEKGRIYTQPFDMNIANQKLTLSGSSGLDQTLDYIGKVAIPRTALGAGNDAINSLLNQANSKAGTSVKLNDIINVNVLIKGTFTSPTISTNMSDIAKSEASSLKTQLASEVDKKKKELETQAKAEADKLKKDAETKLKAEADRLKKEAEAKANAEKDNAKKKLEEEAKKQLKGLFGK